MQAKPKAEIIRDLQGAGERMRKVREAASREKLKRAGSDGESLGSIGDGLIAGGNITGNLPR